MFRLVRACCFVLIITCLLQNVLTEAIVSKFVDETQEFWLEQGRNELIKALNIKHNENVAKNVILFVGDGMGPNTLTAARIYHGGESSQFAFEAFPHVAIVKTYAVNKMVPDSACTATALFSGVKTNFEVVGVDSGVNLKDCLNSLLPERRVKTLATMAYEKKKDAGLVTNTRITHATPSALYSHSGDRRWECDKSMPAGTGNCKDIARQLIEDAPGKHLKVIMGGGRQSMTWNLTNLPNDPIDTWSCQRADGRNLLQTWKEDKLQQKLNCRLLEKMRDLKNLDINNTDCVLGIFANGHMNYEHNRDKTDNGQPSLANMTRTAIQILAKNPNGFILVVEGGLIDQAHHRGHARQALEEVVAFNSAIEAAMELTSEEDTLIVVTSDHAHNLNINGYQSRGSDILGVAMNSKADGVPYTTLTYTTGEIKNYQYFADESGHISRQDPVNQNTTSYEYSQQAGILNDEATHGGVDVAVFARGPMAHLLHGVHEQSYISHVIQYAARIGQYQSRGLPKISRSASSSLPRFTLPLLLFIYIIFH